MDNDRNAKALLDPPAAFQTPAYVLADNTLTKHQKVEILRRWEYDACEVSVAEDEGMPARDGETLKQILQALRELVGEIDANDTPPTKQGGLSRGAVGSQKQKP